MRIRLSSVLLMVLTAPLVAVVLVLPGAATPRCSPTRLILRTPIRVLLHRTSGFPGGEGASTKVAAR